MTEIKKENKLKKVEDLLYLAEHFYTLGSHEDAIYLYQKLTNYPEYIDRIDIAIKMSKCLFELERYQEVLKPFYDEKLTDTAREFLNIIADKLEKKESFDEAVEVLRFLNQNDALFNEYVEQQKKQLDITIALQQGDIFFKKERFKEGVQQYKLAINLGFNNWNELYGRFQEYYSEGHNNPHYLLGLGSIYLKQEEYLKAIEAFEHALKVSESTSNATIVSRVSDIYQKIDKKLEQNPIYILRKGLFYFNHLKKYKEAIRIFTKLLEWEAYQKKANINLGLLYFQCEHWTESLEAFENAQPGRNHFPTLLKLGKKMEEQNLSLLALRTYRLIEQVDPEYKEISLTIKALELKEKAEELKARQPAPEAKMKKMQKGSSKSPLKGVAGQRYDYMSVLGSGGMGSVYKVYDRIYEKTVALKVLHPNLIQKKKSLERFFREAQLCSNLNHENIVEVLDFGLEPKFQQCYITMEFIDGISLRDIINKDWTNKQQLSKNRIKQYVQYTLQILLALDATHRSGIIHRDIKPDNILLTKENHVIKVTDFGIAHIELETLTQDGMVMGTPKYMSPEQVMGQKPDLRSDIYSTGILLYEMLSGEPPFNIGDIPYQHLHVKPLPLQEIFPIVSKELDSIILQSLEKKPDDRFRNASALAAALEKFL